MSLRFRLNLAITLMIVVFTIVTGKIIVDDMRRSIREEIEAGTRVTVQLLETVIASAGSQNQRDGRNGALLSFLHHVGRVRANEIRYYDNNDVLLYVSPPSVYKRGRWAPDWFTGLVRPEQQAFRLNLTNGATIVVTPDPSRSILDAWDDLKSFGLLILGFFIVLNALVFWLLGRWLRPLGPILDGLVGMEQGRFGVRLPGFGLPEFGSISHGFNRMAQVLEDSLAENRRLALAAQQSSDAIIIHDLAGRIQFWNAAAERLFGYRTEEIVGQSAALIAPESRRAELRESLEAIKRRERIEHLETQRLARDGRAIDIALSAAPLVDPASGQVIGEICNMRDITEHKRMQAAERELEENRRLTQLIQSHLEEERRSIARELHDELGQCVTAIKTIGTAIANRARDSAPETHDNAKTIVSVASRIYDVVHGIIRKLRPSTLDHLGLAETLRGTVAGWRERHPEIECELRLAGDLDTLGETVNITVYRIVQECLTNVARHALATSAEVVVTREPSAQQGDAVTVIVRDDGKGLSAGEAQNPSRFGLLGMRERVQAFGGSFEITGSPGQGVIVRAVIPVADGRAGTVTLA